LQNKIKADYHAFLEKSSAFTPKIRHKKTFSTTGKHQKIEKDGLIKRKEMPLDQNRALI